MTALPSEPVASDLTPAKAESNPMDKVGIVASVACAIHCLIAPLLLLFLPAFGTIWSHPAAHWIMAALVLPLALIVIYRGYRKHRRRSALVASGLGVVFIVAGLILPTTSEPGSGLGLTLAQGPTPVHADSDPASAACPDTCCPSIVQDAETGATHLSIPPASLSTIIGSVLLVLAHGINLHGCRCFSRSASPDAPASACGCVDPE